MKAENFKNEIAKNRTLEYIKAHGLPKEIRNCLRGENPMYDRTVHSLRGICAVAAMLSFAYTFAEAQTHKREPHAFLQKHLGFTQSDLNELEKGQVVTKLPKTNNKREIATFGIVRVNASREVLVKQFRDIVNFKKSEIVLQIGTFSNPPQLEDLNGLTIDDEELIAIKDCKVNDCDLKLPAEIITRFQKEVKWSAPNWREQADKLIRQMLIDYVVRYLKSGNSALGEYNDKKYSLRLADEVRSLLQQSPYINEYVPEFHQYLEQFPNKLLAGTEDFIYWSKEVFGLKPVLSLTHVTIYRSENGGTDNVLIASKQIYASHYFESSLGLTAFGDERGSTGSPASYLMYLNRSRTDVLRGSFSGMKRMLIAGKLRGATEKNLRLIKRRLETVSGAKNTRSRISADSTTAARFLF